jgi:hypothetical protein
MKARILFLAASLAICVCTTAYSQVFGYLYIDPGHGGPGADSTHNGGGHNQSRGTVGVAGGTAEQWINLRVALALRDTLLYYSCYDSADFMISRMDDTTDISLPERIEDAYIRGATAFVSIHHNGLPVGAAQATEVRWCDRDTTNDGDYRPVAALTDTLPKKMLYRILETFRDGDTTKYQNRCYNLNKPDPMQGCMNCTDQYVTSNAMMANVITEASSISSDTVEEGLFLVRWSGHTESEASALFWAWQSYEFGQGFGRIDYQYVDVLPTDYFPVSVNFVDYGTPYEQTWLLSEWYTLMAKPFTKDGYQYSLHHWEEVWWSTGDVIRSYDLYENPIYVTTSLALDGYHYYVAYFTGGRFSGQIVTPNTIIKQIQGGDPFWIQWNVTEGILNSCSLYVDFSSNAGSTWATIAGPLPYNNGYEKVVESGIESSPDDRAGQYLWSVPEIAANDCYLRIRASDDVGNHTTFQSNKFAIAPCILATGWLSWNKLASPPRTYRFTATRTAGISVNSRQFIFGDGTTQNSLTDQVDHTYARGGRVVPSLVLTNDCGTYTYVSPYPLYVDCGYVTPDADGDGVADDCDNCPSVFNGTQLDTDLDHTGDACDNCPGLDNWDQLDSDSDGKGDLCDNCPSVSNSTQIDTDGDGYGDACDVCPSISNANQQDSDGDGKGNLCDNCPTVSNANQLDSDGDGRGDACDNCLTVSNPNQANSDGDAFGNACDNCPQKTNTDQADFNGDGIGDACCCVGRVGDVNGTGQAEPTLGDVSTLIDVLFISSTCVGKIDCFTEADVNQSGGAAPSCSDLTIGDISYLVDYLFITGPSLGLADCP